MAKVEVLLRENLKHLGKCGDIVRVAPGYARNFLLPRNLAMQATAENSKAMNKRRAKLDVEEAKQTAEVMARVSALAGVVLKTSMKADDSGHLYGSVNPALVVALLAAQGHTVDEKSVKIEAPIKSVGSHKIKIHVHGEHDAEIPIEVEKEGAPAA